MNAPAAAFQDDGPTAALISDGRRLHLNHGPIDLIIEAEGSRDEVLAAYRQARERFQTILTELASELPVLRLAVDQGAALEGVVARRMRAAVLPFVDQFITPMAAVAGSVADEILAAMVAGRSLSRAFVNNGGDIALHLGPGARYAAALVSQPNGMRIAGRVTVTAEQPIRGIATSGRHGRSHSLGIADAVTVLAETTAAADAAATMVANAVDLPGSREIERVPARELSPDSDLGGRLVTIGVGELDAAETGAALDAGAEYANTLLDRGLIGAAFLALGDVTRSLGAGMSHVVEELEPNREKLG